MTVDPALNASPAPTRRWLRWRPQAPSLMRAALLFALGVAATVAGLLLIRSAGTVPEPLTVAQVEASVAQMLAEATPEPPYSTRVYERILPSLVVIRINDFGRDLDATPRFTQALTVPAVGAGGPFSEPGWVMHGVGGYREVQAQTPSLFGSGVIVSAGGAILTAYHVVERAAKIDITFADGTEAGAAIVAVMPHNDIAVLQADTLPEVWAPATLGNPGALRIGDEAFAIGNPLGLAASISAGVISGLDRTYPWSPGEPPLERLIQFDSAVNPGSAGGPLLNRNGEVVGIVVGPANPTAQETFIGIGFAVRIDVAGGAAGAPDL